MKISRIITILLVLPFACFSQVLTNVGTDFWIAFPPNSPNSVPRKIFISSNYTTHGTISSAYPGVDQNFNVVPGIVTQLDVPFGVTLFDGIEDKGIRVTAQDPIAVYGLNRMTASTDAYMALPISSLGTDYRILTYKTTLNTYGSGLSVVATQNGTVISVFNHQTGGTFNYNLDAGQTFHTSVPTLGEDLTGSTIQSNYPIAVYGSVQGTEIPDGCFYADHIVEQMFPINAWGKKFITVPTAGRDESGDIFRVLANENGTDISINGTSVGVFDAGDFYEANLTGYNSIITSKASLVAQFAKGTMCAGNLTGDPFMMLIMPREQFLTNYTISTVAGFVSHWVNIVAPSYALGSIYQDGVLIPTGSFIQVGTTGFYGARIGITEGSHTFNSASPFGVVVYGWTNVDSYGYPGGGSLSPVGTVNSITISPPAANGILNVTSVCFTAHVEDDLLNPVQGVLVNFNISGINPVNGTGYTDASGNAQYCYTQTGTIPGIDQVYAEIFGYTSTISTVNWNFVPTCTNPVAGGIIGSDQTSCGSFNPVALTNAELPSGETGTLEYKWQESVTGESSGFNDIGGSNSPDYAPGTVLQDTWYRRLARVDCMSDWTGAVASNAVKMTVIPVLPVSISISASTNPYCSGTSVTCTALPVNGGTSPSYQWSLNSIPSGSNSFQFTFVPSPGDVISCALASSEQCTSGNPATSNVVTMVLNENFPAGILITADKNPFCTGSNVQCQATAINGGTNPAFQWSVNGAVSGTNSSIFTFPPQEGDAVQCTMTSDLYCVSGNPVISNILTMQSLPLPVVTMSPCFDMVTTVNAKPFRLKGGFPYNGSYSGPGVDPVSGLFNPQTAGTGTKSVTYTYSNVFQCSASQSLDITVLPSPGFTCGSIFTDVRDNQTYKTVQIGSQCWMAENLMYGSAIPATLIQSDNCISEKHQFPSQGGGPATSFYQWDELMNYEPLPAGQGLCPPGWHVPTESEWTVLLNHYLGNSRAGFPLQDPLVNEFIALPSGVYYHSTAWSFADFAVMFWTSTLSTPDNPYVHGLNSVNFSVSSYQASKANSFPARCLQD